MTAQTSLYDSDALPTGTVDAVVIGGGAAGLNGALMPARAGRAPAPAPRQIPRPTR